MPTKKEIIPNIPPVLSRHPSVHQFVIQAKSVHDDWRDSKHGAETRKAAEVMAQWLLDNDASWLPGDRRVRIVPACEVKKEVKLVKKKKANKWRFFTITRNARVENLRPLELYQIEDGEMPKRLGSVRLNYRDVTQAALEGIADCVPELSKFPRNFKIPDNAKLTSDRRYLVYSNNWTCNYPTYLFREESDKKILQLVSL